MAAKDLLAQALREDLAGDAAVERAMFGGVAFLLGGHMVAGVQRDGTAMFRVGPADRDIALAVPGAHRPAMGLRPMTGMVALSAADATDPARRARLLVLALRTVRALPPKAAKPARA